MQYIEISLSITIFTLYVEMKKVVDWIQYNHEQMFMFVCSKLSAAIYIIAAEVLNKFEVVPQIKIPC